MKKQNGFTLIELLVTLAVVAILATVAVPNFSTMIKNDRQTSQVNSLMSGLILARSTAITTRSPIMVCPSSNGKTCAPLTTPWTNGWVVGYGANPAPGVTTIIRVLPALTGGNTLTSNWDGVLFRQDGTTVVYNTGITGINDVVFTLCDSRGSNFARGVHVFISGAADASNTVGKDSDTGTALVCE